MVQHFDAFFSMYYNPNSVKYSIFKYIYVRQVPERNVHHFVQKPAQSAEKFSAQNRKCIENDGI